MDSSLGSESRSSWATFITDLWYFEEKNSKSARAAPQNLRAVKSIKLLVYLTRSAAGLPSLQKKPFSSQVHSGYLIFHMKWPGEAIWSILLPENQTNKIFSFPFFPLFFTSILTTSSWIALGPLCIDKKIILDCPSGFFRPYFSSKIIIWLQWKNTCFGEKSRNILS